MITIMKKNAESDEGFVPHMAMTHNEFNGGAANGINKPLSMKSHQPLSKSAKAAIERLEGKEGLQKASYRNKQRMLESAIESKMVALFDSEYYGYIWLKDFDETTAVFEYRDTVYAVDYVVSETGMISLSSEIQEVVQQDVYVSEDGKSLVLKYKDSSNPIGDDIKKGVNPEEGNDVMSEMKSAEELSKQLETLQKGQENAIAMAVEKALANQAEAIVKAKLVADTQEVVKGFEVVLEADQEAVVKSLVSLGDESVLIIKALSDMQAEVVKAKAAVVELEKSVDEVKEEFAEKEEGVEVVEAQITKSTLSMKERVAASLASQK